MKRTDLIALAKRVAGMKLPPGYNADAVTQLADFARQIAQAESVMWRYEVRFVNDDGTLKVDWRLFGTYDMEATATNLLRLSVNGREGRVVPLYTLPLED